MRKIITALLLLIVGFVASAERCWYWKCIYDDTYTFYNIYMPDSNQAAELETKITEYLLHYSDKTELPILCERSLCKDSDRLIGIYIYDRVPVVMIDRALIKGVCFTNARDYKKAKRKILKLVKKLEKNGTELSEVEFHWKVIGDKKSEH